VACTEHGDARSARRLDAPSDRPLLVFVVPASASLSGHPAGPRCARPRRRPVGLPPSDPGL